MSAYGGEGVLDPNDLWRVQVVDDVSLTQPSRLLRPLTTRFQLRHVTTGCLLWGHPVVLPEWGFKQYEVVCHKVNTTSSHATWNVELHKGARRCLLSLLTLTSWS